MTQKKGSIISCVLRLENRGRERASNFTPGHRADLRQSPELCSDNSAGAAGDAEMQEAEPVFTYQFLEVFPKLSSKTEKYAEGNSA